MGRGGIGAVHVLEVVAAESGSGLRYQRDVAELQSCKSQIAVVVLQAMARKFSVDRIDILTHFGGECFAAPGIVFFPADQLGIVVAHETGLSALGVFVEHTSVGCYESFKRCGVGRQAVDIVILLPESCEHVVE